MAELLYFLPSPFIALINCGALFEGAKDDFGEVNCFDDFFIKANDLVWVWNNLDDDFGEGID